MGSTEKKPRNCFWVGSFGEFVAAQVKALHDIEAGVGGASVNRTHPTQHATPSFRDVEAGMGGPSMCRPHLPQYDTSTEEERYTRDCQHQCQQTRRDDKLLLVNIPLKSEDEICVEQICRIVVILLLATIIIGCAIVSVWELSKSGP